MQTDFQIRERIEARKAARELLELAEDDPEHHSRVWWLVFWEQIFLESEKSLVRLGYVAPAYATTQPMPDDEARHFAQQTIPFGSHVGETVDDILGSDPGYIDWLVRATEADHFKQDLRRYLRRQDIQDQLPE